MKTAILLWTSHAERRLLGLSLFERALLAASYAGVERVAVVGDAPAINREDGRKWPELVAPDQLQTETQVLVLPADLVYDRGLLATPEALTKGPLQVVPGSELGRIVAAPEAWLEPIGHGEAPTGRGYALRVTDDATAKAAHRALMLSLRKPIDGFISKHLNRHISTFISSRLAPTGVRPNTLTLIFMVIGVSSGWLVSFGSPWWLMVLGAFCFQAQSVLDGCDGEIARLTYRFSHVGQWLDSVGDDLTNYAFCFGLAVGQARVTDAPWLFVAGLVILGLQVLVSGVCYRRLIILGTGDLLAIPDLTTTASDGAVGKALQILRLLTKRDVFVFVMAVLTAIGLPLFAFFLFAGGTIPTVIGVILNDIKITQVERARSAS